MTQFKVGDRVAVYHQETDYIGQPSSRSLGTIKFIEEKGIKIFFDGAVDVCCVFFHPKQCRKLKPKTKPREIIANITTSGILRGARIVGVNGMIGIFYSDNNNVVFRAVREKK